MSHRCQSPSRLGSLALAAILMLPGFVSPRSVAPSYVRYLLWELAAHADVVAAGEIVGLDKETFVFRVDSGVLGAAAGARLEVRRFEDWTCHGRWAPYAVGQRLMVFLRRDEVDPRKHFVMGAGDEGELPFIENDVVAENSHSFGVRGYEVGTHFPAGKPMEGTRLPAADLSAAVIGFREAFQWTSNREVSPRLGLREVEAFARTSKVAGHMVGEAMSSRGWRGPVEESHDTLDLQTIPRIVPGEFPELDLERWTPPPAQRRRLSGGASWFGHALAMVGDVDGDGIGDMLVGAPRDSTTGHAHGAAWLLYLDRSGGVRAAVELRERNPSQVPPMNEFSQFGAAVASLGDLDGNSVPDVAVGAPGWDGAGDHRGGVWILFLERDASILRAVEIGDSPALSRVGVTEGSGLGASIATLGDLDGDGTIEMAIGQEPTFDIGWKHGRAVHVVSVDRDAAPTRASRMHGRDDGFGGSSWFGDALCALGDVDGDGVGDLAIADTMDNDGGQNRGAVWVVQLAKDGAMKARQKISDWHGGFEGRLVDGSGFGKSVAGPGDVDGDGIPDLLVGSGEGIWTLALRRDGSVRSFHCAEPAIKDREADYSIGVSIAPAARHPDSDSGVVLATAGAIGKGLRAQRAVWWLRTTPDGRLTGR